MKKALLIGSVFGLILTASGSASSGADWPQWRGPDRTAISPEDNLLEAWPADGPPQRWLVETGGEGYAAPAVVDGIIYLTGSIGAKNARQGILYSISTQDGSIKWQVAYGPEWGQHYEMSRTTPTVRDDSIYLVSGTGIAACFDVADGRQKWSVDTIKKFSGSNIRWGIAESPLVVGNKFICHPGGADAAVVALNVKDGSTVWTTKGLSETSAYCSPLAVDFDGRTVILTQTAEHIVGLQADDGRVLWKVPQKNRYAVHPNTPVYFDDKIFISSGYGYGSHLLKVSEDGGNVSVLWNRKEMDNHFQGAIYVENRIFGSASGGNLLCLNPENGDVVYKVDEVRKAAIIYADGCIYAYDDRGGKVSLVKVEPDRYEIKGSFQMSAGSGPHWAHPVIADGTLYIRHGQALAAYDIQARF